MQRPQNDHPPRSWRQRCQESGPLLNGQPRCWPMQERGAELEVSRRGVVQRVGLVAGVVALAGLILLLYTGSVIT